MGRLEELLEKQRDLEVNPGPIAVKDKTLVEQVLENQEKAHVIQTEIDRCLKSTEVENHKLQYDLYAPKIRALEDERDHIMQGNIADYEEDRDLKQKEIEELYLVVNQVRRILTFLHLERPADMAIDDDDITTYRDKQKVNLDYIFEDEYLKIKLFIVENDKPKNKYSLIALGRTLFTEDQLKLTYGYGLSINTKKRCQLQEILREGPSVEELLTWLGKPSQSQLLTGLQGDYHTVKAEYLDAIEQYQIDDFRELLTDLCTCGNFLTTFDSMAYRNEVQKCGRCGKEMEKLRNG